MKNNIKYCHFHPPINMEILFSDHFRIIRPEGQISDLFPTFRLCCTSCLLLNISINPLQPESRADGCLLLNISINQSINPLVPESRADGCSVPGHDRRAFAHCHGQGFVEQGQENVNLSRVAVFGKLDTLLKKLRRKKEEMGKYTRRG